MKIECKRNRMCDCLGNLRESAEEDDKEREVIKSKNALKLNEIQ